MSLVWSSRPGLVQLVSLNIAHYIFRYLPLIRQQYPILLPEWQSVLLPAFEGLQISTAQGLKVMEMRNLAAHRSQLKG